MSKMITGATDIRNRLGVSESTFMELVNFQDLPAKKNKEGVFEISERDLKNWENKDFVEKEEEKPEAKKEEIEVQEKSKRGRKAKTRIISRE